MPPLPLHLTELNAIILSELASSIDRYNPD